MFHADPTLVYTSRGSSSKSIGGEPRRKVGKKAQKSPRRRYIPEHWAIQPSSTSESAFDAHTLRQVSLARRVSKGALGVASAVARRGLRAWAGRGAPSWSCLAKPPRSPSSQDQERRFRRLDSRAFRTPCCHRRPFRSKGIAVTGAFVSWARLNRSRDRLRRSTHRQEPTGPCRPLHMPRPPARVDARRAGSTAMADSVTPPSGRTRPTRITMDPWLRPTMSRSRRGKEGGVAREDHTMQWETPAYCELRLGFEVTAYVSVR